MPSSRSRPTSSPWFGISLLSLVVAATSFAVPAVLPRKGPLNANETLAASTVTTPATTLPAPTPTTLAPTPATPAPTSTTPKPTKPPKPPKPTFKAMTINPWAKTWESSGIAVTECPMCASGKRVQYLGQGHYVIVRLKDVKVPGKRTMTIIYTCACDDDPRELDVSVNSDPVHTLSVKGAKSWDTPARVSLKVTLGKGANVIRFFNQEAPAPDLDQVLIR
jgi:hypothetical protein